MTTNGESKFSYLLIALGLGAIGGLMAAILARKETRELLRERSGKSLDYLNQQAEKLREGADKIAAMTKEWIGRQGESLESKATELQKAYQDRSPGA